MGWPENELWSVKPRVWEDLPGMPPVEQVCRQVLRIEEQVRKDLELFGNDKVIVVDYEKWPYKMGELIDLVSRSIDARRRKDASLPSVRCKNEVSDQARFEEIERTINRIRGESPVSVSREI